MKWHRGQTYFCLIGSKEDWHWGQLKGIRSGKQKPNIKLSPTNSFLNIEVLFPLFKRGEEDGMSSWSLWQMPRFKESSDRSVIALERFTLATVAWRRRLGKVGCCLDGLRRRVNVSKAYLRTL